MSIDGELYRSSATRGQVAGVALKAAVALMAIRDALRSIKSGGSFDSEIDEIDKELKALNLMFDELVGWTSDGS